MADAKVCTCGHSMGYHATGARCWEWLGDNLPCPCRNFIAPIPNVDTTATRAVDTLCTCGHIRSLHDGKVCRGYEDVRPGKTQPCSCTEFDFDLFGDAARVEPHDPVLSPAYYRRFPNGVEPRHIAGHLTFHLGTALAYVARAGFKGDAAEDIRKAIEHLRFELERLGAKK